MAISITSLTAAMKTRENYTSRIRKPTGTREIRRKKKAEINCPKVLQIQSY
jgi:hypothetical protein